LNEYEIYQQYSALKAHFNSNYDYHKYQGKSKFITPKTFEKCKDKGRFIWLAKNLSDPKNWLLANILADKTWIGDFNDDVYLKWMKKQQSLTYIFTSELNELNEDLYSNFVKIEGQLPVILQLYFTKKISLETLIILLDIVDMLPYYERHLQDDVLWAPLEHRIKKYKPFLSYNRKKFRTLTRTRFTEQS